MKGNYTAEENKKYKDKVKIYKRKSSKKSRKMEREKTNAAAKTKQ